MNRVYILIIVLIITNNFLLLPQEYKVIDIGQSATYDTIQVIPAPQPGEPFYGGDSQHNGIQFSFLDNGNGTITDQNTGLMWQKYLFEDKFTYDEAMAIADTFYLGGFNDWSFYSFRGELCRWKNKGISYRSDAKCLPKII